jgi:hypothetical protein
MNIGYSASRRFAPIWITRGGAVQENALDVNLIFIPGADGGASMLAGEAGRGDGGTGCREVIWRALTW